MDKVKIHEIADEAGLSNGEMLDKAKELGFNVKVSNSTISMEDAFVLMDYAISGTLPKGNTKSNKVKEYNSAYENLDIFDTEKREDDNNTPEYNFEIENFDLNTLFDTPEIKEDDFDASGYIFDAIAKNKITNIERYLSQSGDLNCTNMFGQSPLEYAIVNSTESLVKFLVDKGADINHINAGDHTTPLTMAFQRNNTYIIKLLIKKGARAKLTAEEEVNFLLSASKDGQKDIIKYLISNNVKVNIEDTNGMNPLHYIAREGYHEIMELLIDLCDINHQDDKGKTALMYACHNHHFDIAKFLLSKGVDKDIEDMQGYSIIDSKNEEIKHFFRHTRKHNPKILANALQQFSSSKKLRYTNHPWDNIALSYDKFIQDLKEGWEKIEEDIKALSKPLYDEIKDLLFSDTHGWSSKAIEQEIRQGNYNSTRISDLQKTLKSLIVVKQNDKKLKLLKIFTNIKMELKQHDGFQITLDLNNIKKSSIDKFFTDTSRLEQALKLILIDINENAIETIKDVVVEAEIREKHDYVELKIIHINSIASLNVDKLEETIMENGGNFKSIYDNLTSVCDWSIDTVCSDGNRYKIDYLYPEIDSSKPHATKIDDSSRGFTHILRFYI